MTDHNSHVHVFQASPLAQRLWLKAQIADLKEALERGGYPSADAYFADKDRLRKYEAALIGKTAREYDPMGYWHSMQSN